MLVYAFAIVIVVILIVYVKLIRPEKRTFDEFRAQGVGGEPFVPLFGQLPELLKQ